MRSSERLDAAWACARYEEIRPRLPAARFPETSREIDNLSDLMDRIDVFVLDGFGVLNIGASPVPGAPGRIAEMRAAGKQVLVLTNGASHPVGQSVPRYRDLGFEFAAEEIVSSRDALARALAAHRDMLWGFTAVEQSAIGELAPRAVRLLDDPADYAAVDGFALLGTGDWNRERQAMLEQALRARPRPVMVGNPDLVAPREDGLSPEPGLFAHELADRTGCAPAFFGKPFPNVFDIVRERIREGVPADRIAMVGDTPQTDILGGAKAGWQTVLVRDHGLLKGFSGEEIGRLTDIRPDFIARTT